VGKRNPIFQSGKVAESEVGSTKESPSGKTLTRAKSSKTGISLSLTKAHKKQRCV